MRDCDLDQLDAHIQTAMSWTNSHIHHSRTDDKLYGHPRLLAETFGELGYKDSTRTRLRDILPERGGPSRFAYEYDFGDGWLHGIRSEGREPAEPRKRYPLCLEGERACPPEDVGGAWGYRDFLAALDDPGNERHEDARAWIGRRFDPEAFNPARASTEMRRGLPSWWGTRRTRSRRPGITRGGSRPGGLDDPWAGCRRGSPRRSGRRSGRTSRR